MKIAVSGASGLIGSALTPLLREDGHTVVPLVRRPARDDGEISWDPVAHRLDPASLADVDAVVHLGGAGVGDKRWTSAYKKVVLSSRVDTTSTLADALAAAEPRPRVLLSGSAVGWYGDTGARVTDESGPRGTGFLADVCAAWEASTAAAQAAGVRVVHLRTGLVCSRHGGFLGRVLPLFKLGGGGRLGSGRQYWPWISLPDQIGAIRYLLTADHLRGPVNLTGPEPVTNAEFTRVLASVLGRPAALPVPGVALKLALGGFAEEGVLTGQRAVPGVLTGAGYTFTHPTLEQTLRWVTGTDPTGAGGAGRNPGADRLDGVDAPSDSGPAHQHPDGPLTAGRDGA